MSDSEARKAATIKMAQEFYEMIPGVPEHLSAKVISSWDHVFPTKHYQFCLMIASQIVAANSRVFK